MVQPDGRVGTARDWAAAHRAQRARPDRHSAGHRRARHGARSTQRLPLEPGFPRSGARRRPSPHQRPVQPAPSVRRRGASLPPVSQATLRYLPTTASTLRESVVLVNVRLPGFLVRSPPPSAPRQARRPVARPRRCEIQPEAILCIVPSHASPLPRAAPSALAPRAASRAGPPGRLAAPIRFTPLPSLAWRTPAPSDPLPAPAPRRLRRRRLDAALRRLGRAQLGDPSGPGQAVPAPPAQCPDIISCSYSERNALGPDGGYRFQTLANVCGANCTTQYWVSDMATSKPLLTVDPGAAASSPSSVPATTARSTPACGSRPHYGPNDPACCPTNYRDTTYTWNADQQPGRGPTAPDHRERRRSGRDAGATPRGLLQGLPAASAPATSPTARPYGLEKAPPRPRVPRPAPPPRTAWTAGGTPQGLELGVG